MTALVLIHRSFLLLNIDYDAVYAMLRSREQSTCIRERNLRTETWHCVQSPGVHNRLFQNIDEHQIASSKESPILYTEI